MELRTRFWRMHKTRRFVHLVKVLAVSTILFYCLVQTRSLSSSIRRISLWVVYRTTSDADIVYPVQSSTTSEYSDITLWSNDFHVSTVFDLKSLLIPLGVNYIDKSLSGSCTLFSSCPVEPIDVITQDKLLGLNDIIIGEFYQRYRDDPLMSKVDAFVCFHPASTCELFMPFRRPIIVIASTRYELGRFEAARWRKWNENLIRISKDPFSVVAANNKYDAEYIRYFTGIEVKVFESFCDYTSVKYNPKRQKTKPFLLSSIHANNTFKSYFMNAFRQARDSLSSKVTLLPSHEVYPSGYRYRDLIEHPGIVFVPYQVSIMSFFERYRMNIPMFFPSLDLLTNWQYTWGVVAERTWDMTLYGRRPCNSTIQGALEGIPDPNDECDMDAIRYWLQFSDFYTFPHVILYESLEDLVSKLEQTDLSQISSRMKTENYVRRIKVEEQWSAIFHKLRQFRK